MMTSAFLSTLSLSAEQNCAQNSGAKRRVDINCLIMIGSLAFQPRALSLAIALALSGRRRAGNGMTRPHSLVFLAGLRFDTAWPPLTDLRPANIYDRLCQVPTAPLCER